MDEQDLIVLAYSNASRLVWALVAIYAMVLVSRWLDRRVGLSFRDEYSKLSNLGRSIYLSSRWIGIAIVVAAVFGR